MAGNWYNMVNLIMALLIVLLVAIGLLAGGTDASSVVTAGGGNDNDQSTAFTGTGDVPTINHHIEATNPKTWPSGDKVWDCCRAIAYAEGYNVAGSVPARLNNPGDLSDGKSVYGSEFHSGSNVTTFPDAVTGWTWLYAKLQNALLGRSNVYNGDMSWREIGAKWAPPKADVWAGNVATALGVDPDSSLNDYVNG